MIDPARWFWCGTCNCAAIKCSVCNNTSCNGGGCDICNDDFDEVIAMKLEDRPKKEDVPYHPPFDWSKYDNTPDYNSHGN